MNKVTEEDIETFRSSGFMGLYQRLATRFAVYPGRGTPLGLLYCALKLNGEAGELAEHVGKAMRDDDLLGRGHLTPERRERLLHEIGDELWYLSSLCNELGTTLDAVALANLKKLAGRTQRGTLQGSGDDR